MEEEKKPVISKELDEKIAQALKSGKYFICVTCDVGGKENMKHFWVTQNFPKDRILSTLEYFKDDLTNKELRDVKKETWE